MAGSREYSGPDSLFSGWAKVRLNDLPSKLPKTVFICKPHFAWKTTRLLAGTQGHRSQFFSDMPKSELN